MKLALALAIAATMALASAAVAENSQATAVSGDQAAPKADDEGKTEPAKPAYDPNQIVCKASQVTGSRLGARKVCRTRAEWDRTTRDDQNMINTMQSRVHSGPGG